MTLGQESELRLALEEVEHGRSEFNEIRSVGLWKLFLLVPRLLLLNTRARFAHTSIKSTPSRVLNATRVTADAKTSSKPPDTSPKMGCSMSPTSEWPSTSDLSPPKRGAVSVSNSYGHSATCVAWVASFACVVGTSLLGPRDALRQTTAFQRFLQTGHCKVICFDGVDEQRRRIHSASHEGNFMIGSPSSNSTEQRLQLPTSTQGPEHRPQRGLDPFDIRGTGSSA